MDSSSNPELDIIISYLHHNKETNKLYSSVPEGYKIVFIPKKVKNIQYNIGRFTVKQELTNESCM